MIDNLRAGSQQRAGLAKTNLARFTGMLQGQRDLTTVGRMLLSELASFVNAQQGVIYQMEEEDSGNMVLTGVCHQYKMAIPIICASAAVWF